MRAQKTRRAAERDEEPLEPVKATTTPPRDDAALDALLDDIEEVLEDPKPEPPPMLKLDASEPFALRFLTDPDEPTMGEMMRYYQQVEAQMERDREMYARSQDGIPWEEIAKLPPPGPGGREMVIAEPEEITWTDMRDDTVCIRSQVRYRVITVTRAMWEEARRGVSGPWRSRLDPDDGMCPRCGHPKAGPGYPPCGDGDGRFRNRMMAPPPMVAIDSKAVCKITNV